MPVCSPSYAAAHGRWTCRHAGAGHVLLHLADPLLDWEMFWGAARRRTPRATWLEFSDYAVVLQGAMNGEGIALGWITVVARALGDGKLVPASNDGCAPGGTITCSRRARSRCARWCWRSATG